MFLTILLITVAQLPVISSAATDTYFLRDIKYTETKLTWSGAWSTCVKNAGNLISIHNNVTITALLHMLSLSETSNVKGPIWTGLHNIVPDPNPDFQWANCDPMINSSYWFEDEPTRPEENRCVIAGQDALLLRTMSCNGSFVFVCEEDKGACSYDKQSNTACAPADPSSKQVLEGEFDDKNCKARCTEDTRGTEICWAYQRGTKTKVCTLFFGSDPYMCESTSYLKDNDMAQRRCFTFTDITGSKEQVIDSYVPVSDCVPTTVSPPATTTSATTSTSTSTQFSTTVTTAGSATTGNAGVATTPTSTGTTAVATTGTTLASTAATSDPTNDTTAIVDNNGSSVITTPGNAVSSSSTITSDAPSNATAEVNTTPTTNTYVTTITSGNISLSESTEVSNSSITTPTTVTTSTTHSSRSMCCDPSSSSTTTTAVTSSRLVYSICVVIKSFTAAEILKRTEDMVEELTLDKKNLSSYLRTKSSAKDERASAQNVGGVGIMLMVIAALIIVVPDCITIGMKISQILKKKSNSKNAETLDE